MQLRRYLQSGAVFADALNSISDLEDLGYTVNGDPTITKSARGNVLVFDGTNDYITLNADMSDRIRFNGSTQDFSISLWFKKTASDEDGLLFDCRDASADGWRLELTSTTLLCSLNAVVVSAVTADTNWHHLAATMDRNGLMTLYVDSVSRDTSSINGQTLATSIAALIGRKAYNVATFFSGNISDLIIFDSVLSADEVSSIYNNSLFNYEKHIVSQWDLSTINPVDIGWKGLGNDGVGHGLVAGTDIVDGHKGMGKAIEFNGVDEYVSFTAEQADSFRFNGSTQDFSVSMWFKKATSAGAGVLFDCRDEDNDGWRAYISSTHLFASLNAVDEVVSGGDDTSWHHLVMTCIRSGGMSIYLDGPLGDSPVSISGEVLATTAGGTMGRNSFGVDDKFNGRIDDVRIFDIALNALQVKDLYSRS